LVEKQPFEDQPDSIENSANPSKSEAAAKRLGLKTQDGTTSFDRQSLLAGVGGWLGIVESITPSLAFVISFSLSKDIVLAVSIAGSLALAFIVLQLIKRKPVTNAIAGAVGIGISAYLPLREGGQPADYFVQGFFTNAIYLLVLTISVLLRWPIIGVLVGLLNGSGSKWRKDKAQLRRFSVVTTLWMGLFAARLAVQLPLYFAGQTEALGVARIAMGVPLYAFCIWISWLLLKGVLTTRR
jgi:hypothetical protein